MSAPLVAGLIAACGDEGDDSDAETDAASGDEAAEDESPDDEDEASTPGVDEESGTDDGGAAVEADGWVIALTEEPTGFDTTVNTNTFSNLLVETHFFERLIDVQGDDLEITPLLAESWEVEDDVRWIFQLRPGVLWHNGDEFTSDDVRWTIERMQEPESRRGFMVAQFESVEAPDPETVIITTDVPYGPMIAQIADISILPMQAYEELGPEAFSAEPIGTGPYVLTEWARDQHLILDANTNWWNGTVTPERLTFRPIEDPSTRVAELRAGGVDIIQSVPTAQLESLNEGDTSVVNIPAGRLMIYPFNMTRPPFDDVRVRQAIHYGTNRAEVVDALLGEYGTLMAGPFTHQWMGHDPDVEPYPYDPERARALLEEAGQQNLQFTWNITDGVFLGDREVAEALANQLSEIGVTMNLQVTERASLQEDFMASEFDLTSLAWATRADPDPMLTWVVGTRDSNTDEEVKDLIAQGSSTVDMDEREEIYQQVHRLMAERAEWLFVYAQAETFGKRADSPWSAMPTHGSVGLNLFYSVDEG